MREGQFHEMAFPSKQTSHKIYDPMVGSFFYASYNRGKLSKKLPYFGVNIYIHENGPSIQLLSGFNGARLLCIVTSLEPLRSWPGGFVFVLVIIYKYTDGLITKFKSMKTQKYKGCTEKGLGLGNDRASLSYTSFFTINNFHYEKKDVPCKKFSV